MAASNEAAAASAILSLLFAGRFKQSILPERIVNEMVFADRIATEENEIPRNLTLSQRNEA
jgi:hypothetical protein